MLTTELCARLGLKFQLRIQGELPQFPCEYVIMEEAQDVPCVKLTVGQNNAAPPCLSFLPEEGAEGQGDAVVFAGQELVFPIYQEIRRLLEPEQRLNYQLTQLDRAYLAGGLPAMTQLAQEFLENPVLLVDRAFNVLALAPQEELGIDSWDRILRGEFVELNDLRQAQKIINRFSKKNITSPQIIPYQEADGRNVRRMTAPALEPDRKTPCGGMEIIELRRPFKEEDKRLAERMCQLLSHHLNRLTDVVRANGMEEQLLYDLLYYTMHERRTMERRLKQFEVFSSQNFYYLAIISLTRIQQQLTGANLRTLLMQEYPEGWCLLAAEQLLIVLPSKEPLEDEAGIVQRLDETGKRMGQPVFLSMPFQSLMELKDVWKFDAESIPFAGSLIHRPGCHKISDFFEQFFFKSVSLGKKTESFVHPALVQLRRYDEENKTNLLETLSLFLVENCDLNEASGRLYIHRNTLLYRLRRIEALVHLNLKDRGIQKVLSLGCKIMAYQS